MNVILEEIALEEIRRSNPTAYKVLNEFYNKNKSMLPYVEETSADGIPHYRKNTDRGLRVRIDGLGIGMTFSGLSDETSSDDIAIVQGHIKIGNTVVDLDNTVLTGINNNQVQLISETWRKLNEEES